MNNTKFTLDALAAWVSSLMMVAEHDMVLLSPSFFKGTEDAPFSIVGGWKKGFSKEYSDLLYVNKSNPESAMCIKIVENKGPHDDIDFNSLTMPIDSEGKVDDTCVALELDDVPEGVALFYLGEWERIMEEHQEA